MAVIAKKVENHCFRKNRRIPVARLMDTQNIRMAVGWMKCVKIVGLEFSKSK
jgi:hypothetical protein